MARPSRCRRICAEPSYDSFSPAGFAGGTAVEMTVDEYEVIRILDYEGQTQEQCAELLQVSRTTVTMIYERARHKLADCLVNGRPLEIRGGNYRLCEGANLACPKKRCGRAASCAAVIPELTIKGGNRMRIAVSYENGNIFQHFGHTENFKLYDLEDGKVVSSQVIPTLGQGHGALASFLAANRVDALICGGIGGGAQQALAEAGIKLYGGVTGSSDAAVEAFAAGTLGFDPNVRCSHHDHEHGAGGHTCGSQGCGKHTCR